MQFAIATNWDPALLEALQGTSVTSLYGQIINDPLGGGRMALFLPPVGPAAAAEFIAETRRRGLGFNYLANATCFDNQEFTREGFRRMVDHLQWVAAAGADTVTVALPFLADVIRRHVPQLKVCASSFARVSTVGRARFWEELGAAKIILPEAIARNFTSLRRIREAVDCELELIANHACLFHCPFDLHHRNMVSHGSQAGHVSGGFAPDFCKLSCQRRKLADPAELIRCRWIRPEDVDYYAALGIDCLKLVERFRGTESLLRILEAYEKRRSPANLAEVLTLPRQGAYRTPNLEVIRRSERVDPAAMAELLEVLREPFTDAVHIDGRALDGFLAFFETMDCDNTDCRRCGYCANLAGKVVRIDETWRQAMLARFDHALNLLKDGVVAGLRPRATGTH
jgi:collagenase-like PrtC family protease